MSSDISSHSVIVFASKQTHEEVGETIEYINALAAANRRKSEERKEHEESNIRQKQKEEAERIFGMEAEKSKVEKIKDHKNELPFGMLVNTRYRDSNEIFKILADLCRGKAIVKEIESGQILIMIDRAESLREIQLLAINIGATLQKLDLSFKFFADSQSESLDSPKESQGRNQDPSKTASTSLKDISGAKSPAEIDSQDAAMDRDARQLAMQFRSAKTDEQTRLRQKLEQLTANHFEYRQQRRKREINDLTQRLDKLRTSHQHRQENKTRVITQRINDLLDPNADLKWEEPQTASESSRAETPRQEDRSTGTPEGISIGSTDHNGESGSLKPTAQSANGSSTEPTYNGVTLNEWLKILRTERNPKKVAESVQALNHLAGDADPRSLICATLHMMRSQGEGIQRSAHWPDILNSSIALLCRLPSDTVVEEVVREISEFATQKASRYFLTRMFSNLSSRRKMSVYRSNFDGVTPTVDEESIQSLRRKIRNRSRMIVSAIVNVVRSDEALRDWGIEIASHVLSINEQPLNNSPDFLPEVVTTYPDLVPLVEKTFADSKSNQRHLAAVLLGASGLHVPEVLAYAEDLQKGKKNRTKVSPSRSIALWQSRRIPAKPLLG